MVEHLTSALGRRRLLRGGLALAGLSVLAGCRVESPQPSPRPARIGVLSAHAMDPSAEGTAFRAALRDLGYTEGRNLVLTFRLAGQPETLASAAAELIGQGVNVIVTVEDEATHAAKDASATVPIVMTDTREPVRAGLIASLARPGGNVTGLTSLTAELGPKRLELLRLAVPSVRRVAFLWQARTDEPPELGELQAAAQGMGLRLLPVSFRAPGNLALPLAELDGPVDGAIVLTLGSARADGARITALLNATRLPAIYDAGTFVHAGGLMSYGAKTPELFRRAATYVDKILKGTKPADLPVEQPTTFDFSINLKTARTLGLMIPESVLQQATEVIQ
jgi:putative tryptophan/tyrosine transport system substrate-binding protein